MTKFTKLFRHRDVIAIAVVAFLVPYIFVHVWWLRLACIIVVSLAMSFEIIRQITFPDLMFRDDSQWNPKAKTVFIWFGRLLGVFLLPLFIYFGIFIPVKDAISAIANDGPIVSTIQVLHDDDETGFTRLVVQDLVFQGETKHLPLYLPLLRNGDEYQITYFPDSYFIYDAVPVE